MDAGRYSTIFVFPIYGTIHILLRLGYLYAMIYILKKDYREGIDYASNMYLLPQRGTYSLWLIYFLVERFAL